VDVRYARIPFIVAALGATAVLPSGASAQLSPQHTYAGIGRSVGVLVTLPDGAESGALQLLRPVTRELVATAIVKSGRTDLAASIPRFWELPVSTRPDRSVLYAQLSVADTKIGPPLVIQPLFEPESASQLDPLTRVPQFRPGRAILSGVRVYTDRHVMMDTTLGQIEFVMRPDEAPNTVWNFLELAGGGFYNGVNFHRIVALNDGNRKPFVIQGGDPIQGFGPNPGEGGPGYQINLEKSALPHDFGVISMARSSALPNSAGSQFFICLSREGTSHLDGQFASFGQAVSGADVIQRIAAVPVDKDHHPKDPVTITSCRVVDAPPFGEGPKPVAAPSIPAAAR
jgi:peptidyl-prolyl cis-trans isomerase B (cyclophilin B)